MVILVTNVCETYHQTHGVRGHSTALLTRMKGQQRMKDAPGSVRHSGDDIRYETSELPRRWKMEDE
ncbi:hypothetical protein RchiOBHm_Chr7g0212581 [Rosa chinensis]|uniref:Uncharacterized protein n=1 Tax=Rosa chinensis TaxID=74649 RepID=A0A2P6PAS0_ROSCH|nr:hypothetical protein RchiOBHm_Chr7g0212581 [Rosa chinensis]